MPVRPRRPGAGRVALASATANPGGGLEQRSAVGARHEAGADPKSGSPPRRPRQSGIAARRGAAVCLARRQSPLRRRRRAPSPISRAAACGRGRPGDSPGGGGAGASTSAPDRSGWRSSRSASRTARASPSGMTLEPAKELQEPSD